MSVAYLVTWLLVYLRAVGTILLLPTMAGYAPPIFLRLALPLFVATLLAGLVPPAAVPAGIFPFIVAGSGEVLVGLALGFVGQLTFSAVDMAGRIISSEVGLTAAPGIGGPGIATGPISSFVSSFAVVLFFLLGGHLGVISAFARSFALAPPGRAFLAPGAAQVLIAETARLIELGVRMAAPFLALNFLVTLAFSVLGRAVPRMGVFVMSSPVRTLAGLALLGGAGALFARYLAGEYGEIPFRLLELLPAR